MAESDGQVIERLTRENMMLRAMIASLEGQIARRDARVAELERLLDDAGEQRDARIAQLERLLDDAGEQILRLKQLKQQWHEP